VIPGRLGAVGILPRGTHGEPFSETQTVDRVARRRCLSALHAKLSVPTSVACILLKEEGPRLKRTLLSLTVLLSAASAQSGAAPDTWGVFDVDRGYEWVAASRALTLEGLVETTGVHERLRRGLEWQLRGSSVDHGLKDGEIAATDEWCASPTPVSRGSFVQTEQDGRFISALLLAEVAVTATLAEATPGFFSNGNPGVLFELADVVPLHGRSALPAFALVPADRLVIRGRVFCSVTPSEGVEVNPEIANRVVLLGEWGDHGAVRIGTSPSRLGHLALVRDDRETLQWDFFPRFTNPPASLSQLYRRVGEAATGGLLDVTGHLALQEYGSPERVEFVERLGRYEANGCRVVEIVDTTDQGWSPARLSCPDKKVPDR